MERCANCNYPLEKNFRYCPSCSQKIPVKRFTLLHILQEFFQAFTSLDKGIYHLIGQLTVRPGVVAREYILAGKRKKYYNPFSFLLLVLGLYLAVNALTNPYTGARKVSSETTVEPSSGTTAPADEAVQQRRKQVNAWVEQYTNLLSLLAIPLFALIFYLCFFRSGIGYAEHLVAHVFFSCYYSLISLIATLVLGLFLRSYLGFLNLTLLLFQWIYLTVAYYQFLGYQRRRYYLITTLVTLLALLIWIAFTSGSIYYYTRYGWPLNPASKGP